MSRQGRDAATRHRLILRGKASPVPIRTNLQDALEAAGLEPKPERGDD